MNVIELAEKGWVPDSLIRFGIRRLCEERLCDEQKYFADHGKQCKSSKRLADLQASPIAIETQAANEQHYEVPTAFYQYVLGKALKYSCSWWDENTHSLDEAEEKMLAIYAKRAEIENGHHILDLGCGWGFDESFGWLSVFRNAKLLQCPIHLLNVLLLRLKQKLMVWKISM